jgi:S-adenosylmethionine:tRNA ribosyltransferase-isomerase
MSRAAELRFEILTATEPPEDRNPLGNREDARLLVTCTGSARHTDVGTFKDIHRVLQPGSLIIRNRAGCRKAAINGTASGIKLKVFLSNPAEDNLNGPWIVKLYRMNGDSSITHYTDHVDQIEIEGGVVLRAIRRWYEPNSHQDSPYWICDVAVSDGTLLSHMETFGEPIRYSYISQPWPIEKYRFHDDTGITRGPLTGLHSAEMASAGRAWTPDVITLCQQVGYEFAYVELATGVSPLDGGRPGREYAHVPAEAADAINRARAERRPVIFTGTTSLRALLGCTDATGHVTPYCGWTDRLVSETDDLSPVVDGIIIGFHEQEASHLNIIAAMMGSSIDMLLTSYQLALESGFLWHEFGDLHLIVQNPHILV